MHIGASHKNKKMMMNTSSILNELMINFEKRQPRGNQYHSPSTKSQQEHAFKGNSFGNVAIVYLIWHTKTNDYFCFAELKKTFFPNECKKMILIIITINKMPKLNITCGLAGYVVRCTLPLKVGITSSPFLTQSLETRRIRD